jgi:hypothetical protein
LKKQALPRRRLTVIFSYGVKKDFLSFHTKFYIGKVLAPGLVSW